MRKEESEKGKNVEKQCPQKVEVFSTDTNVQAIVQKRPKCPKRSPQKGQNSPEIL